MLIYVWIILLGLVISVVGFLLMISDLHRIIDIERNRANSAQSDAARMESAIRIVCSQRLDDLCWMDFKDLADAAGCYYPDLRTLPKAVMLRNCERYVDCLIRCEGDRLAATRIYKGDWSTETRESH